MVIINTQGIVVKDLESWYGEAHILHGINLTIKSGECVALLGRNGSGRSTCLKSIMGIISKRTGSICINGSETLKLAPNKIAHLGVGFCPEERGIFTSLTCEENLWLPKDLGYNKISIDEIHTLFPALKERAKALGGTLSGGEQQMLAIARILRAGAQILLLDEISEGLSPLIIQLLTTAILKLKQGGYTILLVEQNLRFASKLADRMYVIEQGKVIEEINQVEFHIKLELVEGLLGV